MKNYNIEYNLLPKPFCLNKKFYEKILLRALKDPSSLNICLEKQINYWKWFVKKNLNILHTIMVRNDIHKLQELEGILNDIYELSYREDMYKYEYLFSRRMKANKGLTLLEKIYNSKEIWTLEYDKLKKNLKEFLLENFSKQILPYKTWIVNAKNHKTEIYQNPFKWFDKKVLEEREYIGINPEVFSDLDAPSVVTALTPPHYEQPWHDHWENWEITFYCGASIWKYKHNGKEYEIPVDFWDFIIFPPKTRHTIKNPTDNSVRNISVKLPSALLDRWKVYTWLEWKWSIEKLQNRGNGFFEKEFSKQKVPYKIKVFIFDGVKTHIIEAQEKSLIYVISGWFTITWIGEGVEVVKESDAIVLEKNKKITFNDLKGNWRLYMVELLCS